MIKNYKILTEYLPSGTQNEGHPDLLRRQKFGGDLDRPDALRRLRLGLPILRREPTDRRLPEKIRRLLLQRKMLQGRIEETG